MTEYQMGYYDGLKEMKGKLDAARSVQWNNVKDGTPKRWRMDDRDKTLINYLVYSPDYGVDIGNWVKSAKMWVCMGIPVKVTHWMPLPEHPKEEK